MNTTLTNLPMRIDGSFFTNSITSIIATGDLATLYHRNGKLSVVKVVQFMLLKQYVIFNYAFWLDCIYYMYETYTCQLGREILYICQRS